MTRYELDEIIKSEGDYYEWTNSIKCFIRRNNLKSWCGYITIPKSFPISFEEEELNLSCHGGITYHSINESGDLVVGFDCSHFGDLTPAMIEYQIFDIEGKGVYRDKDYVIDEVNNMVDQVLNTVQLNRSKKIDKILK